jgi:hypothetical protein
MTRKTIHKEREAPPANTFGDKIHTDLWGPSPLSSLGGRKYYVSFTDDHSCYMRLALLCAEDETMEAYKGFAAWAQTQRGAHVKRLQSDRGGEYTGGNFTKFLQEQGTERRLTTHDTLQHNGVAELLNRRLLKCMHAMLHASGLPKNLWGEAIQHTMWLKNRTSTRVLSNVTPFECLYGEKPNLGGVLEWGQRIWVHDNTGSKLDVWANEAQWVGYDSDSMHTHRVYWLGKNSISVERDIKFVPVTVSIFTPPPSYPMPAAPKPGAAPSSSTTPPAPVNPILPPTLLPVPTDSQPDSEEEEDEVEQEIVLPDEPGASKTTKKQQSTDVTQQIHKSQCVPKPSDRARCLAAGEGITGDTLDLADCLFSTEFDNIVVTAMQDADGDPKTLSEAQTCTDLVFESPVAPTAKRLQPNPTQLVATQLPVAVAEILR